MGSDLEHRIRNVTAVLGPTNTGKTHLAIERMLGHDSGMIGLPLRLLAREVYDKIAARVGAEKVALVTGEEKIKPDRARYWVATVEAMPRDVDVDFLAIDEVQLASDPERGHVFTDRLLHSRGRQETLLLGAQTMSGAISDLIPGANFITRPRLSKLTYSGEKKITRLPQRTAVVAFSANEVYSIAELIRRQRGGTAVVLGALSPRTRNAQVALYQSGDVDFLVATDAIGMGLNLDVDQIAFSAVRKFDGQSFRNLTPSEIAQIAGRAGRHMNDGTFCVTGACDPFDADLVERIETHTFEPVRVLQWRNRTLDFTSLDSLRESLRELPNEQRLTRARMADDVLALETVADDREVSAFAKGTAAVTRLWEVCQIPDYRKISSQNHAELVATLYKDLMGPSGAISEDWFAKQVEIADRTDGDIDTLANRLAHIRTWTFVSNRADWLKDPGHWQGRTRAIEDALSDALHECLTQRFVDRRTSALMKGMRDKEEMNAEISEDGAIHVEKHYVGRLKGFLFSPETHTETVHGKAARSAAAHVLSGELGMRARRVAAAGPEAFKVARTGEILWKNEPIAKLEPTDDPLKPSVALLADEHLQAADREKVLSRLTTFIGEAVAEKLKPLVELNKAEDVTGLARGIAFRLKENLGALKREAVAEEIKSLDQNARAQLRKYGVRFGAFNIHFPLLLKPAAAELTLALWSLKNAASAGLSPDKLPEPPRPGLTSVAADPAVPEAFYRACGYHVCGPRAVRFDMLERLADLIRPLLAWRKDRNPDATTPIGSTGDGGFTTTPEMMSILGCSPEELGKVLKALGFRLDRRLVKRATPPAAEPTNPVETTAAEVTASAEAGTTPLPAMDETSTPPADTPPPSEATTAESVAPIDDAKPAEASPAEDVFEDVWRPKKHHRAETGDDANRRNRGRNEGRHRHDRQRRQGQGQGQGHGQNQGQGHPRAATSPDLAAAAGDTGTAIAAFPGKENTEGQPQDRGDRRRDDHRHRGGNRDSQHGRHESKGAERGHSQRQGEGPNRDRARGRDQRRDRDRDRRRSDDGNKGRTISASPPRKAEADNDSPFAALMALRAQLEQAARDKSSS
ncbi:MAG: helicase-related protein [Hyphomicrobium sp.]|nr:helicase-related protein [Hyphomicrobium sp.]